MRVALDFKYLQDARKGLREHGWKEGTHTDEYWKNGKRGILRYNDTAKRWELLVEG